MRRTVFSLLLILGTADAVKAETCIDKLNEAVTLADALPPSPGRAAVLRDIARARDSHHEGLETDCLEEVDETLALLKDHSAPASNETPASITSERTQP